MQKATTTINYIPLYDRLVIKEDAVETKTAFGIIIPDSVEQDPKSIGIVVAVGCGFKDADMIVKCGDRVNYSKHAGTTIKIDNVEYRIMREMDIFGIFPKEPMLGQAINVPNETVEEERAEPDRSNDEPTPATFYNNQLNKRRNRK